MIKILNNPKTEKFKELKNLMLGSGFPWHWVSQSTCNLDTKGYDDFGYYSHIFLDRPDYTENSFYSRVNSNKIDLVHTVLVEILKHNNITPQVFYRICANCTHPTETNRMSVPHVDHYFPHSNLILYLTDPNGGETVVEKEKFLSKEDDVIVLKGEHHHRPPIKDRRIVIVSTFI
jgi:hypothetical protein